MPKRDRRRRSFLIACATGALALSVCPSALAWHDAEQRITDDSAYTLPRKSIRLGPFKQDYSVHDRVTLGTSVVPWAFRVANLHAKWRFLGSDPISVAASAGFYRFETQAIDKASPHAIFGVFPFELTGSYRFSPALSTSAGLVYTAVTLTGEYNAKDFQGAAALSNMQLTVTPEWRLSRVTALVLHSRLLLFQQVSGGAHLALQPDAFTTVDVRAAGRSDALDYPFAWSVVPSVVFSWKTFNLRVGVGYGNFNVPGVNFMLPKKTVAPDFDLYFIF